MEAQRVISVSLGKIAQSRVQRSGCSLHKSLMVASILQKARHLYVEQAFMMHCRPQSPAASPAAAASEATPTYTDLDTCSPAERGASGPAPADASTATATATAAAAEPTRRKRLISDEETEEAVASILPKRARTESCGNDEAAPVSSEAPSSESVTASSSDSKDADSDDSDDSCYESGDSDDSEADAMEIDRITSLVSVFSFDSLKLRQKQTAADSCSSQRTGEWDLAGSDPVAVRA